MFAQCSGGGACVYVFVYVCVFMALTRWSAWMDVVAWMGGYDMTVKCSHLAVVMVRVCVCMCVCVRVFVCVYG
jgi:hypothetical protein